MSQLALLGGPALRTQKWPAWPQFDDTDKTSLITTLENSVWGGYAPEVEQFQKEFAQAHQAKHCILVNNGTVSLFAALKVLGIGPGDEVIVPAYTFVATASAVVLTGATPVFVDIHPKTFNISIQAVKEALSNKTKAVIPVHFSGQPVPMEELQVIAKENDLFIVEDCAHACLASRNDKPVGTYSEFASFSFQQKKNLTCGEGGALLTNDTALAGKLWSFINQGRLNQNNMWYGHASIGSNLRMTALQATLLQSQFKRLHSQQKIRQESIRFLNEQFAELPFIETMEFESNTTFHGAHVYVFKLKLKQDLKVSKRVILKALKAEGLECSHGYRKPLYQQDCFKDIPIVVKNCPVTEKLCESTISLPHPILLADKKELKDVTKIVKKVIENVDDLIGFVPK